MEKFFKNKKVLITGHTGFKGSWLTQILLNFGADVVGISLPPKTSPNLFNTLKIDEKIKNYFTDIRNLDEIKRIFNTEKPEIVFHLAAQPIVIESYKEPIETISTNVMGTTNILEAIRENPEIKSVIIVTTDKVYENKELSHYSYKEQDALGGYDPYSGSKAAADIVTNSYIQSFFNPKDFNDKHNTLVAIARAGNVIGGGDWSDYRIIPDIIYSIYEKDEEIIIRNPQSIRPWQHVLEPLSGYMTLAKELHEGKKEFSGAWNFGPHDEVFKTVQDLVDEALKILKKGSCAYSSEIHKHEACNLKISIDKAIKVLSWVPKLDFKKNLEYTFDWYRNYYENKEDMVEFTNQQIKTFFNKNTL